MTGTAFRRSVPTLAIAAALLTLPGLASANEPTIRFAHEPGALRVSAGDQPVATYFYQDREITRPFFAHVHAPGGLPVTRHHPPRPGIDDTDHGTAGNYFHPGIWLAFSDLSGHDYWRLKAPVRHEAFVAEPAAKADHGTFTVRNSYRDELQPDVTVAHELCRYTVVAIPGAFVLVSDSLFWSVDRALEFGDEEEMGFAVRVATPLAVKHGGHLRDSAGRHGEQQIRGRSAPWCDYSGTVGQRRAGILLASDAANPFASRYHARDYGLLAANPFAAKAFGEPTARRTVIEQGQALRLRFAVALYSGPQATANDKADDEKAAEDDAADDEAAELAALYDSVVKLLADLPRPQK
ncbi:MAG: PmoA family protein [Pirellulales bacterium]|nr:PmoA family protein [Pirellulales bacterium]